jgi:hypothetical protein
MNVMMMVLLFGLGTGSAEHSGPYPAPFTGQAVPERVVANPANWAFCPRWMMLLPKEHGTHCCPRWSVMS